MLCLFNLLLCKNIRLDKFSLCAIILCFYGLIVGLGHENYNYFFVSHSFWSLIIPFAYLSGYNTTWSLEKVEKLINVFSKSFISIYLICFIIYVFIYLFMFELYLGINPAVLLFVLSVSLVQKKYGMAALSVALVLLSGKRSIGICMIGMLCVYVPIIDRKYLNLKLLLSVGILLVLSIIAILLFNTFEFLSSSNHFFGHILGKWSILNPFSAGYDPTIATASRSLEMETFLNIFKSQQIFPIFGEGYGWWMINALNSEPLHFLHFTPFNYIAYYGIPLTIIFYFLFWGTFNKSYQVSLSELNKHPSLYALALFTLGAFIWSFFAYVFAALPFVWFSLGVLSSIVRQNTIHHQTAIAN